MALVTNLRWEGIFCFFVRQEGGGGLLLGILRRVTESIVAYFAERKGRLFLGLLGLQLDLQRKRGILLLGAEGSRLLLELDRG